MANYRVSRLGERRHQWLWRFYLELSCSRCASLGGGAEPNCPGHTKSVSSQSFIYGPAAEYAGGGQFLG
jgi:hypothetical protein